MTTKRVGRRAAATTTEREPTGKRAAPAKREPDAKVVSALGKIARETNSVLERVATNEQKADNLRVTAAVKLAEARVMCEENKIPFKKWCEENITQGYTEATRLAKIGASDDPKQALADLRAKKRTAMKEHRAKRAAGEPTKKIAGAPKTIAETALAQMPTKARTKLLESQAKEAGLVMVSKADAPPAGAKDLDKATFAFEALSGQDKVKFMQWLVGEMDVDIRYNGVDLQPL